MRSKHRSLSWAGRLKAADLIEFLGLHAAAAPSKGKATDSSGEADGDEAAGGDESEKAVPQVHSCCHVVFRVGFRRLTGGVLVVGVCMSGKCGRVRT